MSIRMHGVLPSPFSLLMCAFSPLQNQLPSTRGTLKCPWRTSCIQPQALHHEHLTLRARAWSLSDSDVQARLGPALRAWAWLSRAWASKDLKPGPRPNCRLTLCVASSLHSIKHVHRYELARAVHLVLNAALSWQAPIPSFRFQPIRHMSPQYCHSQAQATK